MCEIFISYTVKKMYAFFRTEIIYLVISKMEKRIKVYLRYLKCILCLIYSMYLLIASYSCF